MCLVEKCLLYTEISSSKVKGPFFNFHENHGLVPKLKSISEVPQHMPKHYRDCSRRYLEYFKLFLDITRQ